MTTPHEAADVGVRLASVLKALALLQPDKAPDPRKTYSTADGSAYSAGYNAAMAEVAAIARATLTPRGEGDWMSEWLPMTTARKDGTEVLLWGACRPRNSTSRYAQDANIGWWADDHWSTRVGGEACDAIAWQPIVPPRRTLVEAPPTPLPEPPHAP